VDGKPDHLELAKDLAAFANAYGGTIIVGAHESPSGILSKYGVMKKDVATHICDEYAAAQKNRLRPAVLVTAEPTVHGSGFLPVIRIEPSMGQAIGVRIQAAEGSIGEAKAPPETFAFPLRVGDHSVWLQPEQLPMLMIPELRRNIVLLRRIVGEKVRSHRFFRHKQPQGVGAMVLGKVNEEANVVTLGDNGIPLDQIRSVWKDADGWHLSWNSHQE
jgi:hypothetical protein